MGIEVRDFDEGDHDWAEALIGGFQGGDRRVARLGELIDPLTRPGIVAQRDGQPVGLLTVDESDGGLEILTLNATEPGRGIGTALLRTALEIAVASGSRRLWLVTTNDNLPAIRFYLRRGMTVASVHQGALERDRRAFKPEMPETNSDTGLPFRDYVEFELATTEDATLRDQRFPRVSDIDALPPESAAEAIGPLFESAPRFLARLVAERPFHDDAGLIDRATEVARMMPDEEQIALLDAHPRIGADPASVSPMSHAEQGYGAPTAPDPAAWIGEELATLNEAYERAFGFRFVIFVAGRPRAEIVPLLERALRNDRTAELRRGLDDVVHIAADRLATLRATIER